MYKDMPTDDLIRMQREQEEAFEMAQRYDDEMYHEPVVNHQPLNGVDVVAEINDEGQCVVYVQGRGPHDSVEIIFRDFTHAFNFFTNVLLRAEKDDP